jgi:hypothetical protein
MWACQNETSAKKGIGIQMQPYTEELTAAVADFNRRMAPAKVPFQVSETAAASWLPKIDGRNIYEEMFLAVEDRFVRGAYILKHQEFSFSGQIRSIGAWQMPISEGILDKHYSLVGVKLLNHALDKQPLLYGLGIGSFDAAVTRVVLAMGWRPKVIPFFFKVRNGFSFLRNIRYLKTSVLRRLMLYVAAYSGLGAIGARAAHFLLTVGNGHPASGHAEQVGEFSAWADEIWHSCRHRYSMVAVRDANVLNILYPPADSRFIRLKIQDGRRIAGWAVLLDTVMSENKYFGNMRVGSIIDCLATPEDANQVMAAAVRVLETRGVDLLVSNQSHPAWCRGLRNAGFLSGPSNFIFVTSKQLTGLLDGIDPAGAGVHMNRADGDGPIHL